MTRVASSVKRVVEALMLFCNKSEQDAVELVQKFWGHYAILSLLRSSTKSHPITTRCAWASSEIRRQSTIVVQGPGIVAPTARLG